tara:strand:+ start:412 stop:774 length:363 start_codon:yes stop_codon:yes gene_type:complete
MATKAQLASRLKKLGIPTPKSAKLADMEHRLKYWLPGEGFHVRLLRNPTERFANHPLSLLNKKDELYWLPNSEMAKKIVGSRFVLVLQRTSKPSKDATIVNVPSDYDSRWNNGGDNSTNS